MSSRFERVSYAHFFLSKPGSRLDKEGENTLKISLFYITKMGMKVKTNKIYQTGRSQERAEEQLP